MRNPRCSHSSRHPKCLEVKRFPPLASSDQAVERSGTALLKIFHFVAHIFRIEDFPHEHKVMKDIAKEALLMAIRDAGMRDALPVKPEKIRIVRQNDSALRDGEGDMRGIVRPFQPRFRRGRHVDVAAPKSVCYAGMNMLIEVKSDRPGHCAERVSATKRKDRFASCPRPMLPPPSSGAGSRRYDPRSRRGRHGPLPC